MLANFQEYLAAGKVVNYIQGVEMMAHPVMVSYCVVD